MYQKYYSVSTETGRKELVVANDYADAVKKLMTIEDFDEIFGDGFEIIHEGEILV